MRNAPPVLGRCARQEPDNIQEVSRKIQEVSRKTMRVHSSSSEFKLQFAPWKRSKLKLEL